jgi:hypothetical protein
VALQGAVCKGWCQGKSIRSERKKKLVKERNKLILLSVVTLGYMELMNEYMCFCVCY